MTLLWPGAIRAQKEKEGEEGCRTGLLAGIKLMSVSHLDLVGMPSLAWPGLGSCLD